MTQIDHGDGAAVEAAAVAWHAMRHAQSEAHVRWHVLGEEWKEAARLRVRRLVGGAPLADAADAVALDVYRAAATK